ncbi:hypothetical protein FAQ01_17230 [Flavobacterium aquatile]|nr:hypothetical protein FAQ01_17230 [Flavobacterium aquatile]
MLSFGYYSETIVPELYVFIGNLMLIEIIYIETNVPDNILICSKLDLKF